MRSKKTPVPAGSFAWMALVAIAPLVVFLPVLHFGFVWDDVMNITSCPLFQPSPAVHLTEIWTTPYDLVYVPLVRTLWGSLATVGATGTTFDHLRYHAANLIVHLLNVLLVYQIVRRFVRQEWAAACGALLFAVHPLQVEAVAWVSGMRDLLAAFFSFAAILLYLRFADAQDSKPSWPAYAGASVCYVAAMLCKPTSAVLPLIVALLDAVSLSSARHPLRGYPALEGKGEQEVISWPPRQRLLALAAWLAAFVPAAIATERIQPAGADVPSIALWKRLFVAGDSYTFYLGKLVAPFSLCFDYGRTPARVLSHVWTYGQVLVPIALLAAAIALACRRRVAWPLAAAGIFVIGLLPVSGIVPFRFQMFSTVADRYTYFVMLGVALVAAGALSTLPARFGLTMGALVIAGCTACSCLQVRVWADGYSLYSHATEVNPQSWMAYCDLGLNRQYVGDTDAAIAAYRIAHRLKPADYNAMSGLGMELEMQWLSKGRPQALNGEMQEAVMLLQQAARDNDGLGTAHLNLGCAYANAGDPDLAVPELCRALALNPTDPTTQNSLATVEAHLRH